MFTTDSKEIFETASGICGIQISSDESEIVNKYQLNKCVEWIRNNKFNRTCLQFPENLLNDATLIALYLQKKLEKIVYILGDTSYGSCCIDEVAAEHVNGDSIIHFGHACLSPVTKLPVLYIFNKKPLNLKKLQEKFKSFDSDKQVIVFYEDVFHHLHDELCNVFRKNDNISVSELNINHECVDDCNDRRILCGRIFPKYPDKGISAVYIGDNTITLQNLSLALPGFAWYLYTESDELTEYQNDINKFLMQRTHLVEKVKEANVVGILIGTLGIKNYLEAIERIKLLIRKSGKKCYKLAIGKPNVAKLANFPEIDIFVCISCQENSLLKDFKGYYKPVVSLFEIELALGDRPFSVDYTSDFRELLPGGSFYRDISIENNSPPSCSDGDNNKTQDLMEKNCGALVESSGAEFLMNRTWRGLEPNIGETKVCKATRGRTGIPQAYENEVSTLSNEKSS